MWQKCGSGDIQAANQKVPAQPRIQGGRGGREATCMARRSLESMRLTRLCKHNESDYYVAVARSIQAASVNRFGNSWRSGQAASAYRRGNSWRVLDKVREATRPEKQSSGSKT
eukprot:357666-Chlamydomonas_euryale.AAC.4